ncbi:hypothetical protein DCO58_08105 [Helicobacter saguini]|uniref:Uncharacterized protein n=2 Tax=Helicobacter saguini TaxID=1548018 RepID=A0A6L7D5N8_9HELI|nr:hypothetical protein [Helicobacter saguini]MWV62184.1 hypothetical protein [Helicobacter saguini]MWV67142.1 hypothetical protein [Helicobacter saguini]MWV67618.1 hypothetical protein [Helicobacter saguini]MWV69494.1 hypothetical protein [Helicobacter saguini]MWV70954.1 hypothetical protein [Helicobacter saguini]
MNKFSFGKFILDCLICMLLILISVVILLFPINLITEFLKKFTFDILGPTFYLGNLDILNDFLFDALSFTLCHILFFSIWFFLEKKGIMIKYKIYKSSFWFVFILSTSFWWLCAIKIATGPIKG